MTLHETRLHVADVTAIGAAGEHEAVDCVRACIVRRGVHRRHAAIGGDARKIHQRRQRQLSEWRAGGVEIAHQVREDDAMQLAPAIVAEVRRLVERGSEVIAGQHGHSVGDALEDENVATNGGIVHHRHVEEGHSGRAASSRCAEVLQLEAQRGKRLLLWRERQGQRFQGHIDRVRHELASPGGVDRRRDAVADFRLGRRRESAIRFRRVVAGVDSRRCREIPCCQLCH